MVCKWQVEIDNYATRVLEKHWPNVERFRDVREFPPNTDIKTESTPSMYDEAGHRLPNAKGSVGQSPYSVGLIAAGFPCQDISNAGQQAGIDGDRSGLFREIIRVAGILKPRIILLENVAALLHRGMGEVLGELSKIGFDAEWHCLQAADFGAPHIRDRVFILANSNSKRWTSELELTQPDMVRNANQPPQYCDREGQATALPNSNNEGSQGLRQERQNSQRQDPDRYIRQSSLVIRNKPGQSEWWTTEPSVGRVATGIPNRVDRLKGLGNAVVPQIAEWLGRQILERESDVN